MFYVSSQIDNFLNCANCDQRFDQPKIIPCGSSICTYCEASLQINDNKFECCVCLETHIYPAEGFPTCKTLSNLLTIKPEEIHRSDAVDSLKSSLDAIQNKIYSLKHSTKNGADKIKEYCIDLRNEVQLATELKIQQINEFSDDYMKTINKYENDCLTALELNDERLVELDKIMDDIQTFHDEWEEYLQRFKINDKEVLSATKSASKLIQIIDEEKLKLDILLFNGNLLKFQRNNIKSTPNHLGEFVSSKILMNSTILTNKQSKELMSLCGFSINQRWRLLYRSSENGFSADSFHSKVDGEHNTLIIIKSSNMNIFGGFTKQDWSHVDEGYKTDPDAFIFSLINEDNNPIVMKCTEPQYAILSRNGYGPVFGNGNYKKYSLLFAIKYF